MPYTERAYYTSDACHHVGAWEEHQREVRRAALARDWQRARYR